MAELPDRWTWVFDLDNTLYPASSRLFDQIDRNMTGFIARLLNLPAEEARRLQKHYYRTYGTTLRGLMEEHAMDPELYLEEVHRIDLSPIVSNPRLGPALSALPGRKLVFTNGTVAHAHNVLNHLGIVDHFDDVFDIVAADYIPKPERGCYEAFLARHDVDPVRAVLFEDLPRNLRPAHELGMSTVLVLGHDELAHLDRDGPHIHFVAPDLADWLDAAMIHLDPVFARLRA